MKETSDQLEALTAHMDYVQENIADSQASIMEMEVRGFEFICACACACWLCQGMVQM